MYRRVGFAHHVGQSPTYIGSDKGDAMRTNVASHANKIWIVMAALALSACVTINIYFPAAAAEKAADKIIEEVWQTPKADQSATTEPAVKETK
jgi:hypothetical protein